MGPLLLEKYRTQLNEARAANASLQAKLDAMTQVNAELSAKLVRVEANRAAWVKQMAEAHTQSALAYACGAISQKIIA